MASSGKLEILAPKEELDGYILNWALGEEGLGYYGQKSKDRYYQRENGSYRTRAQLTTSEYEEAIEALKYIPLDSRLKIVCEWPDNSNAGSWCRETATYVYKSLRDRQHRPSVICTKHNLEHLQGLGLELPQQDIPSDLSPYLESLSKTAVEEEEIPDSLAEYLEKLP